MEKNQVNTDWGESDKYICIQCGNPAKIHPENKFIWGCFSCDFTTKDVLSFFKEGRNKELKDDNPFFIACE